MNWKIGDKFKIKEATTLKDVYTITRIEHNKDNNPIVYWANFSKQGRNPYELYTKPERMTKVSKLEEVLK
jgi:hypothetical protein